jgi:hypothetical protein
VPETTAPLPLVQIAPPAPADRAQRAHLVRRARRLAWAGLAWHGVEAAVAIGAGIAASSIALVGFGGDSLVEAVAGVVVLWRFAAVRVASADAERRGQRLIGLSFFAIALYVGIEAVRSLAGGEEPDASWVGIGLSVVTLATMPLWPSPRRGSASGSAPRRPAARAARTCSAPTYRRRCSPACCPTRCSAGGGRTPSPRS